MWRCEPSHRTNTKYIPGRVTPTYYESTPVYPAYIRGLSRLKKKKRNYIDRGDCKNNLSSIRSVEVGKEQEIGEYTGGSSKGNKGHLNKI